MAEYFSHADRDFGYCTVNWDVHNFSLLYCKHCWSIQSPEFIVKGFDHTKWLMALKFHEGRHSDKVLFILRKIHSDSIGCTWADLRLNIKFGNCNSTPNITFKFEETSDCEMSLFHKMEYDFDKISPLELDDSFTIVCEMIVYCNIPRPDFTHGLSAGLRSLSEDISKIYSNALRSDTLVDCTLSRGSNARANAIILQARLPNSLEDLHKDKSPFKDLWKPGISYSVSMKVHFNTMNMVLRYLYSGNLKYVVEEPSLALRDFADKFQIREITNFYYMDEISLRSKMKTQDLVYKWIIADFPRVCEKERKMYSPLLTEDNFGTGWWLKLVIGDVGGKKCFSLFAEIFEGHISTEACLEYEIRGIDYTRYGKITYTSYESSNEFGFKEFAKIDDLKSCAPDGILRLNVRLRLCDGRRNSVFDNYKRRFVSAMNISPGNYCVSKYPFKLLSSDLEKIYEKVNTYEDELSPDCILRCEKTLFKAYKCILEARSPTFSTIFSDDQISGIKDVSDRINVDTLRQLLEYIYSGIVPRDPRRDLSQAARDFGVRALVEELQRSPVD